MVYTFQRQTVERAKLALLTDKVGVVSDSDNNNKQSDHLVMMVAYRKWEKILREVSYFILISLIRPFRTNHGAIHILHLFFFWVHNHDKHIN